MASDGAVGAINALLGSAHIFSSAINERMARRLRTVVDAELSLAQFQLLRMVGMTRARSIGAIANFLGVSAPAASKAVSKLVDRRLLRRREDPRDRRAIELTLTARGQELLARCEEAWNRELEVLFAGYEPEELSRIANLLDRFSAGVFDRASEEEEVCLRCGIHFRDRCVVREILHRSCSICSRWYGRAAPESKDSVDADP
jgi:DNA-binding MarR family transcriptional regulator